MSHAPPSDKDAEESVVGAMLMSDRAIEAVLAELEPDGEQTFYFASLGEIYRACKALHRVRRPADAITVSSLLKAKGRLDAAGGAERVHELAALIPATGNAGHYAKIVREQWAKRMIAQTLWQAHDQAMNGVPSAEAAEGALRALLDTQALIQRGRKGPTMLAELAQRLEERVRNPPTDDGIAAPFPTFPRLKPSRLYILGGYTKDGKTSVACQFAACAAQKKVPVGFVSIEMSEEQLFDRMVAGFGVPLGMVESGRITPPFLPAYREALTALSGLHVEVIDDPGASAATIAPLQRARKYGLLIVDHLHRISLGGSPGERRERLEDEVRAFTQLTRTENVPILLLAQLSRSGTPGHPYPRPTATMLRETAVIEHEAALVAFVYRKRDSQHEPTNEAEMIVALNRFGPSGSFPMKFLGEQMRYVELQEVTP